MAATRGLPLIRDQSFYYSTIVIQVENTLFNVPREGLLEPGSHFETVFSRQDTGLAAAFGFFLAKPGGQSDSNPIVVEGVPKKVFKCFLRFLYPLNSRHECSGALKNNPEDTFEVLVLAGKWNMKKLRVKVVDALSDHVNGSSYMHQLSWGYSYQVASWFRRGALALTTRPPGMDDRTPQAALIKEGLHVRTVMKLITAREQYVCMYFAYDHLKLGARIASDASPCGTCRRVIRSKGSLSEVMKAEVDITFAVEMSGGERDGLDIGLSYCNRCCPVDVL